MEQQEVWSPEQLSQLRRQVQLAEQLAACFRQAMGHDLPNHLVAIQGLLRILELEEGERLSPAGGDYVRRISGVTGRMQVLVSTLAELCNVGRGARLAERLALAEVAREAAAEINKLFPDRVIEYHFPEAPFFLTVPRRDLHSVLVQLMRNAAQACRAGQPIQIRIGTREAPAPRAFWIADNGGGLGPELWQSLEEFFAGRLLKSPASGLGLFLVRQIVDHWGGKIHVGSEPGRGAVFSIGLNQE